MRTISRIYHPYWLWEDYKHGMYSEEKEGREKRIKLSAKMLSDSNICFEYMRKVVDEWKYATEYTLTNSGVNQIAWLGQSSCCLYCEAHEDEVREAWRDLTEQVKEKANSIAKSVIEEWREKTYGDDFKQQDLFGYECF
jgi:hypothetical protein